MKNLIKKILREETSGLTDGQIKAAYSLMNMITKGYHWYHDTPEQPFTYSEGSIWLINPETEKWMLELEKSGELWYYTKTSDTFSMYLNMEKSDFELFIKIWVEDALKREVISKRVVYSYSSGRVEVPLEKREKRVVPTVAIHAAHSPRVNEVEDALKNGKQLK
jgi:hypothetical protein